MFWVFVESLCFFKLFLWVILIFCCKLFIFWVEFKMWFIRDWSDLVWVCVFVVVDIFCFLSFWRCVILFLCLWCNCFMVCWWRFFNVFILLFFVVFNIESFWLLVVCMLVFFVFKVFNFLLFCLMIRLVLFCSFCLWCWYDFFKVFKWDLVEKKIIKWNYEMVCKFCICLVE